MPDKLDSQFILRSFTDPQGGEPNSIGYLADHCLWPDYLANTTFVKASADNLLYHIDSDGIYLNNSQIRNPGLIYDLAINSNCVAYVDSSNNIEYSLNLGVSWTNLNVTTNSVAFKDSNTILYSVDNVIRSYIISTTVDSAINTLDEDIIELDANDSYILATTANYFYIISDTVNRIDRILGADTIQHLRLTQSDFITGHVGAPSEYYRIFFDGNDWFKSPGYYHGVYYKSDEFLKPFENIDLNSQYPFVKLPTSNTTTIMTNSLGDDTVHHPADDVVVYEGGDYYWVGRNTIYKVNEDDLIELNNLIIEPISSSPVIDNLDVTIVVSVALDNISNEVPTVAAIDLSQSHSITLDNIVASAATITPVELSQTASIIGEDIVSSVVVANTTLTQVHSLSISNLEAGASTVTELNAAQEHVLSLTNITASQATVSSITSDQIHNIRTADITSAPSVQATDLAQTHNTVLDNISSTATVDDLEIMQINDLAIADIVSSAVVSSAGLTQIHDLSLDNIVSASITVPNISILGEVECALDNLVAGTPSVANTVISQVHNLTLTSIQSNSTISSATSVIIVNIDLDDIESSAPIVDETAAYQVSNLDLTSIAATAPILSASTLGQQNNLILTNIVAANTVTSNIATTQINILGINNVSSTAIVSNTAIGQVHSLDLGTIESRAQVLPIDSNLTIVFELNDIESESIVLDDLNATIIVDIPLDTINASSPVFGETEIGEIARIYLDDLTVNSTVGNLDLELAKHLDLQDIQAGAAILPIMTVYSAIPIGPTKLFLKIKPDPKQDAIIISPRTEFIKVRKVS